jgi:glycosyltransferase involved in cell wall biosynthesis
MTAGFDHARGDIVIPLDGDLQNDPADIPRLIDKLNEGYDVVSGWRKNRQDKFITRKIPSWIANRLIGKITGVRLHDYGCSLKAYRKEVIKHMNLYGDMHRFIPAVAQWYGASVTELPVHHRPRTRGKTKYGLSRTFKVILDLLTIKFLGSFSTRPLHIFGGMGLVAIVVSFISAAVAILQKLYLDLNLNRNPLILLTVLLMLTGLQFIFMGLLAEMLARTYHESQNKPIYIIRKIIPASFESTGEPTHG